MGADIHISIEKRVDDAWKLTDVILADRWYDALGWMGCYGRGSLGIVAPFAERGYPRDSPLYSERPVIDYYGEWYDTHGSNISWCTIRELLDADIPEAIAHYFDHILKDPKLVGCDPDHTRLIWSFHS
jgi:hypothetical protein